MTDADARAWLLMGHTAATVYMTGLIWFVQIVHYPLFARVGLPGFSKYEQAHVQRTGWVVAPPMLIELMCAVAVTWTIGGPLTWIGLALTATIWLSTWIWQVPAHHRLESGFDAAMHARLTRTNWVRTVAWTMRSAIALALQA